MKNKCQNKNSGFGIFRLSAALLFLVVIFWGCEDNPTEVEDYNPEPVLSAFLYNGEPVEEVFLERVGSLYSYYDPNDYGIPGADIIIFPIIDNISAGDTLHFEESSHPDSNGVYKPVAGESLIPEGNVSYRIEARKSSEDLYLWAETVVPDTFTLVVNNYTIINDTLQGTLDWSMPNMHFEYSSAENSSGYVYTQTCFTPDSLLEWLDPDEDPADIDLEPDLFIQTFFVETASSGDVPWIAFSYIGWHRIDLEAVSLGYMEYLTSTIYEDGIETQYNVNGGLGIFGGLFRNSFYLYIDREP